MHRPLGRLAALSLLLALSACGGGADEPAPAPTPAPAPSPQPPVPPASDRIEPFDPALKAKASAAPAADVPLPSVPVGATITLPALPTPPALKSADMAPVGAPLQIGQGRAVDATARPAQTAALLRWQAGEGGRQVATLRFAVTGAQGLRLGVRVAALPEGARLFFQGAQDARAPVHVIDATQLRAIAQRNRDAGAEVAAARLYWSPEIPGEQATLVIELPAQAQADAVRLSVPLISQLTLGAEQEQALAKAGAGSCEVDVACKPDAVEQGRSVARLRFVESDGKAYQCTGTLMNDTASSGTPWLLTAHHCIADQLTASSLVTDWLLRSAACGSSALTPGHAQRTGGATLTYTSEAADTTLVRLNDAPPPGVVYAGSYFGADALPGLAIADVHHPEGDVQKVSTGLIGSYSNCTSSTCTPASRDQGRYFSVRWQQGVVEPGSSGSGAFMAIGPRRYLIGQLFGGTSSCANPNGADYFARFDLNYANALRQWLNP